MKRHLAAALLALALGFGGLVQRTEAQILQAYPATPVVSTVLGPGPAPVVLDGSYVGSSPVVLGTVDAGVVYSSGYSGVVDLTYTGGTVLGSPVILPAGTPFPYSTASATLGQPARWYVPYGGDDTFLFNGGTPYGHAYERYTWGALSGESSLNRYFYPPVR